MKTSDFDYNLPNSFIAQHSVEPRDHSRLLVLHKGTGEVEHKRFFEIREYLRPGDVLVFNKTKVFKARLRGLAQDREIEVFLLRARDSGENDSVWEALLNPGKYVPEGTRIDLGDGMSAIVEKKNASGLILLRLNASKKEVLDFTDVHGEIPIPPYVEKSPDNFSKYQTVYAKDVGSVAAPTAGFHFTESLLVDLKERGIQTEFITLHVGIGTFQPVRSETLEEHEMHEEYVEVNADVAKRIIEARRARRRVIAVGTTTVRTLEGVVAAHGELQGFVGDVNLFIKPGFDFNVIDALITNFHLPRSTLLALVSALGGRENIFAAYEEAKEKGYRFYSFGDAMFIS